MIRYQASSQAEARGWLGLFVGKSVPENICWFRETDVTWLSTEILVQVLRKLATFN
jgi:hypothetical protein